MYDRRVAGRTLRFGHRGILVNEAFVLYDQATDSYWVQATGEAYAGPLKGERLRFLPATITTWQNWVAQHPDSTVLPGRRSHTFMGTFDAQVDARRIGLSVLVRFRAKLYPFPELARTPVVNDVFQGQPLLVAYAPEGPTVSAWSRLLDGQVLTFVPSGERDSAGLPLLRDRETDSRWSVLTGTAVSGSMQGRELNSVVHHPFDAPRFRVFYPDAPEYRAPR